MTAMEFVYRHSRATRGTLTWIALGVFGFLFWVAFIYGAPWFIWLIWGPTSAAIVYLLVVNPVSGLELTRDGLRAYAGRRSWFYPLETINGVEMVHDSEGPDDIVLHLRGGDSTRLPILTAPPAEEFRAALTRVNLPLRLS